MSVLAWRPFLDPLAVHDQWYLLIVPLVVLLSFGYKAVRVPNKGGSFSMGLYLRQAGLMAVQVGLTITLLYAGAIVIVGHLLERIT
ncbi:MAG: hypothetical protein AAGI17_08865 [Planctomycetota bacterium]